jgi:ERCC4-related helicase
MLVDFKPRLYQEKIFSSSAKDNSLVVLPTGLGKTAIALMMAAHRLSMYPDLKIVMLAPTKPLVEQHLTYFKEHMNLHEEDFVLFTGAVPPEKRAELWKEATFIFSTPQGLENDIISSRIDIGEASLMIFDEAHRATGDYSYVFIASRYMKLARFPRVLALTASPGSDKESIDEICKNLYIENIEVRTRDDADVKPYVQETDVSWHEVELPPSMLEIKNHLDGMFKNKLEQCKQLGYVKNTFNLSRRQLLAMMGGLQREAMEGEKTMELLKTISLLSEILKISHAQELLETQGIGALLSYLQKIMSQSASTKTKSIKNLVADPGFKSAYLLTRHLEEAQVEHPKMNALRSIIQEKRNKKKIIFTQYRDSGKTISDMVNAIDGVSAKLFVGQTKKGTTGMSQKEQIATIKAFREGTFNTLVMTSVGEEGLDIPQVDMVIFYEPVPSAIRTIQRRGRTGRLEKGSVIVLYSKGTRDEMYRWSSFHKEKRMLKLMKEMKTQREIIQDTTLQQFTQKETFEVVVDYREKNSLIVKDLIEKNVKIDLRKLDVGDYLLSSRVALEYKRVPDFVDSIIDGRLLQQLRSLKEYYLRPLIIVEGSEDLYAVRKIDAKAIQGMLATITVSYGIPVMFTKTSKETASLIYMITKREQDEGYKEFSFHSSKPLTLKEQQEYLISSLPGIGPKLAKPLLEKFGSPEKVLGASLEELQEIDLIGKKKAQAVRDIIEGKYEQDN